MTAYHLPHIPLILASASSSRKEMLTAAGLEFKAVPAEVDEEELKRAALAENIPPPDAATMIAEMKAQKISARHPNAFVLGADQLLVCQDDWYSKPKSEAEAKASLHRLAGRSHELVTAAVIYQASRRIWHHIETPKISIRPLTETEISAYINAMGEDIYRTPGVYLMEGLGAQIISKISGCPYAVLGLPLLALLEFLREHGLKRHVR